MSGKSPLLWRAGNGISTSQTTRDPRLITFLLSQSRALAGIQGATTLMTFTGLLFRPSSNLRHALIHRAACAFGTMWYVTVVGQWRGFISWKSTVLKDAPPCTPQSEATSSTSLLRNSMYWCGVREMLAQLQDDQDRLLLLQTEVRAAAGGGMTRPHGYYGKADAVHTRSPTARTPF